MDPVFSLKRDRCSDVKLCIICQSDKSEKLLRASSQGLANLKEKANLRQKDRDIKNRAAIERVIVDVNQQDLLVWHKSCYGSFTSQHNISRLIKRIDDESDKADDLSDISDIDIPSSRLRSSLPSFDWNACMFCQKHDTQKMSSITTLKMSQQIIEASKYDKSLIVHLAGVHDLIAAEGKYHSICYKRFLRETSKTRENEKTCDKAMHWLIEELKCAASQGHVLELSEVWSRYCDLAEKSGIEIPNSFVSRRSSFKEKLMKNLCEVYEFIVRSDQPIEARQTVLVPSKYGHVPISNFATDNDEEFTIPVYREINDSFLELVHVALKLRFDIFTHPPYKCFEINEQKAIECVPNNLFMFINLIIGGQSLLERDDDGDKEGQTMSHKESKQQMAILSICQDLIFAASGGKCWSPKHVGLGCALHQATRLKELVQMFHSAGHTISYESVLQVDSALAENTLKSLDPLTGAVTPPNFVRDRFVHFTCDNIDINDSSLNGHDSFHATQVAGWQRGPDQDIGLDGMRPSKNTTLKVPEILEQVIPATVFEGKTEPPLISSIHKEWYEMSLDKSKSAQKADATDMAFFIARQAKSGTKVGWTNFNQTISTDAHPVTSVGYMPIIQNPAHEYDTLNTVILRCRKIAQSLGQRYVVLTVDEALYCKLMELKWVKSIDFLIVRLGGLHTAMSFMKVIGKHIQSSGLLEAWVESNMLGPKAAEQVLAGQAFSRGMRAHKITIQAMWRIIMPQFFIFLRSNSTHLMGQIDEMGDGDIDQLIAFLEGGQFQEAKDKFINSKDYVNFKFWWTYIQMVQILLIFIRAQREGNWELHLFAFQSMLPFFMRYNHTHYARWGTIYIREMHNLPEEIEHEFLQGNFVVKGAALKFNQVDPNQSQEWLNAVGKKGGGIIGITKTSTALSRWALSYNLRSHMSLETKRMFRVNSSVEDVSVHNKSHSSKQAVDDQEENNLLAIFLSLKLFSNDSPSCIQNIVTKDLATEQIGECLLRAKAKGQEQLIQFIDERLIPQADKLVKFHVPLRKNKVLTMASLYDVVSKSANDKEKSLKADRSILQRLIIAQQAGRPVNLCHELLPVPISLALMNGQLRSGSKANLSQLLASKASCPPLLTQQELEIDTTLIIDGQAMVVAIGKPQGASTFHDLYEVFRNSVVKGQFCNRIEIAFDRYHASSIKSAARERRAKGTRPVRKVIEHGNVPLPSNWNNFLALSENKADLITYLSEEIVSDQRNNKTIVVSGGFDNDETVKSNKHEIDVTLLESRHEEADTRIILHCVNSQSQNIIVHARDSDILILMLAHFHRMSCKKLWLKAGTSEKRKFIPIHSLIGNLPLGASVLENLPAFHSLTGSDETSYISGHTKKSAWKIFEVNSDLLLDLGKGELTGDIVRDAETFICRVYDVQNVNSVDKARSLLFARSHSPESLPPTSDALLFHIKRSHYQASVWRQAHVNFPNLPSPETMGWKLDGQKLKPVLMSLPPVPESCLAIISCGCKSGCLNLRCKCKKWM